MNPDFLQAKYTLLWLMYEVQIEFINTQKSNIITKHQKYSDVVMATEFKIQYISLFNSRRPRVKE